MSAIDVKSEAEREEEERKALRNASLGFCGTDVIDGSQLYPPMQMFRSTSASIGLPTATSTTSLNSTARTSVETHMLNVTADALPFYATASSSSRASHNGLVMTRASMQRSQSATTTTDVEMRRNVPAHLNRLVNGFDNMSLGHPTAPRGQNLAHKTSSTVVEVS